MVTISYDVIWLYRAQGLRNVECLECYQTNIQIPCSTVSFCSHLEILKLYFCIMPLMPFLLVKVFGVKPFSRIASWDITIFQYFLCIQSLPDLNTQFHKMDNQSPYIKVFIILTDTLQLLPFFEGTHPSWKLVAEQPTAPRQVVAALNGQEEQILTKQRKCNRLRPVWWSFLIFLVREW